MAKFMWNLLEIDVTQSVWLHQQLMEEVSLKQPPAHDVMSVGNRALNSGLLDAEQTRGVERGMGRLKGRWNALNIDAIEKELR